MRICQLKHGDGHFILRMQPKSRIRRARFFSSLLSNLPLSYQMCNDYIEYAIFKVNMEMNWNHCSEFCVIRHEHIDTHTHSQWYIHYLMCMYRFGWDDKNSRKKNENSQMYTYVYTCCSSNKSNSTIQHHQWTKHSTHSTVYKKTLTAIQQPSQIIILRITNKYHSLNIILSVSSQL